MAGKVTAGLAVSNGSLLPGGWLIVTCGLTAYIPESVLGPMIGNEYGKPLPLPLLNINAFCGTHFYWFLTVSVAVLLVFSAAFAHDSRLRCGVADLYYTLYGRSRPPCLPLPEVCRQFWCICHAAWTDISVDQQYNKIDAFCWLNAELPMWPSGQRTWPPCAVERDALSGWGWSGLVLNKCQSGLIQTVGYAWRVHA